MKTPAEWMDNMEAECASTGESIPCPINPYLIQAIQKDAIESKTFVADLEDKINHYREKWLEARKHLRAANKGAERNAVALQLMVFRCQDLSEVNQLLRQPNLS